MAKRKKRKDLGLSALAVLLFIVLFIFFSGFFVGYSCAGKSQKDNSPAVTTPQKDTSKPLEKVEVDPLVDETISGMSLSDMVYQMMIVSPEEITNVETATLAGDSTKKAIESQPIGGLVYADKNFEDAAQTESLIKNSQSYSKIPLFIAIADDGADKYSEEELTNFGFNLILTDKLKDDFAKFEIDGVTISKYEGEDFIIEALESGADIIYNSTELEATHGQILKAVEDGRISEDLIRESVKKILTLKLSRGILN